MNKHWKTALVGVILLLWVAAFVALDVYAPKPAPRPSFPSINTTRHQPRVFTPSNHRAFSRHSRVGSMIRPEQTELPQSMIPDEMRVHTRLHYVGSLCPRDGKINVTISDRRQPVSLFLNAYESCTWQIHTEPGVQLAKVIVAGYEPQTVTGITSGTPLFSYDIKSSPDSYVETRIATKAQYLNVLEKVQYLTGVRPETVQFDFHSRNYVVDGLTNITFPDFNEKFDQRQVKLRCSMCMLGPDGLRATFAGPASMAYATRSYHTGKRYFEGTLTIAEGQYAASSYTNIGITSSPQHMTIFNYPSEYGYSYGALGPNRVNNQLLPGKFINREQLKSGDNIGIAVDYDRHKMYFRLNGNWIGGSPSSSGGMSIKQDLDYAAIASTSTSSQSGADDMWTVNFGSKSFKYGLPPGYSAYGISMNTGHASTQYGKTLPESRTQPSPVSKVNVNAFERPDEDRFTAHEIEMYRNQLKQAIVPHWNPPKDYRSKPVTVQFRISRTGQMDQLRLQKSSGFPQADEAALEAVRAAGIFPSYKAYANSPFTDVVWNFGTGKELKSAEFVRYGQRMKQKLMAHWRPDVDFQGRKTEVSFAIDHSGRIKDVRISKSSQNARMDNMALAAVRLANPLPSLPEDYPKSSINVIWTYEGSIVQSP